MKKVAKNRYIKTHNRQRKTRSLSLSKRLIMMFKMLYFFLFKHKTSSSFILHSVSKFEAW